MEKERGREREGGREGHGNEDVDMEVRFSTAEARGPSLSLPLSLSFSAFPRFLGPLEPGYKHYSQVNKIYITTTPNKYNNLRQEKNTCRLKEKEKL